MCVIATGIKKDFAPAWFESCCKSNPDGFFVSRVNKGQYIRTLDMAEAQKFFDESEDKDEIVLHARIKSVGVINLDNVHGWAARGLQFCHNGTLTITADKDKTDSETFFRKILLPAYQANNKRIGNTVKGAIAACIGSSRFLIVRNKKVHLFGDYKEKGKCKFSNLLWDVPKWDATKQTIPEWDDTSWYKDYYGSYRRAATPKAPAGRSRWGDCHGFDDYDNYDAYGNYIGPDDDLGYGVKSRQQALQKRGLNVPKTSASRWKPAAPIANKDPVEHPKPTAVQQASAKSLVQPDTKAPPSCRLEPRSFSTKYNLPDAPFDVEQMSDDEFFLEVEKILGALEYAKYLEYYYSPIQGDYVKNPHYNPSK